MRMTTPNMVIFLCIIYVWLCIFIKVNYKIEIGIILFDESLILVPNLISFSVALDFRHGRPW